MPVETQDGQVILEEEVDENYEPTQQGTYASMWPMGYSLLQYMNCALPCLLAEILEYAAWLGMDPEKEKVGCLGDEKCLWALCCACFCDYAWLAEGEFLDVLMSMGI